MFSIRLYALPTWRLWQPCVDRLEFLRPGDDEQDHVVVPAWQTQICLVSKNAQAWGGGWKQFLYSYCRVTASLTRGPSDGGAHMSGIEFLCSNCRGDSSERLGQAKMCSTSRPYVLLVGPLVSQDTHGRLGAWSCMKKKEGKNSFSLSGH